MRANWIDAEASASVSVFLLHEPTLRMGNLSRVNLTWLHSVQIDTGGGVSSTPMLI